MSNRDDLRARLVRYDHDEPRGYGLGCPGMIRAQDGEWVEADYAIDLLRRIGELEGALRTLRGGIFVDADAVNAFIDEVLVAPSPLPGSTEVE